MACFNLSHINFCRVATFAYGNKFCEQGVACKVSGHYDGMLVWRYCHWQFPRTDSCLSLEERATNNGVDSTCRPMFGILHLHFLSDEEA